MPDELQRGLNSLDMAIRALERARGSFDMNERLRCIHNGTMLAQEAHDLIVGWRTGQAPKPGNPADPATDGSPQV